MQEIGLDELPMWSPWPARLLGLEPVAVRQRTPLRVMREYDIDKYGPLLDAVRSNPALGMEDVKRRELGDPQARVAMSIGERLYGARIGEAVHRTSELLLDRLLEAAGDSRSIVDLGCGYGYHLAGLARRDPGLALAGGEYSPRGVELASLLHPPDGAIAIERFDYREDDPGPLGRVPAPALVFSSYVLHQLPSASVAVDWLARQRESIARVVIFDAERSVQPESLLGLMRRRYMEVNDYSWDLLDVLAARSDVEIERVEPNVIGSNALLPASLMVWRFSS